jgi:hypothetical protein
MTVILRPIWLGADLTWGRFEFGPIWLGPIWLEPIWLGADLTGNQNNMNKLNIKSIIRIITWYKTLPQIWCRLQCISQTTVKLQSTVIWKIEASVWQCYHIDELLYKCWCFLLWYCLIYSKKVFFLNYLIKLLLTFP